LEKAMDAVVLISANTEWRAVRRSLPDKEVQQTPFGESIRHDLVLNNQARQVLIMHGGWGKIAASASAQYAIDRWQPKLLVNLGTCGGFEGHVERGEIILVEKTLVYDIYEQMGDPGSHIDHYTTHIDLSWLEQPYPCQVRRGLLVSGDRDLAPAEIGDLKRKYGATAGDWESGAIAFVAQKNSTPILILRGVSDLVSEQGGEAYGDEALFDESANRILKLLLNMLPDWLEATTFFR
jgi:adenosylhomocysteine nucleosidase